MAPYANRKAGILSGSPWSICSAPEGVQSIAAGSLAGGDGVMRCAMTASEGRVPCKPENKPTSTDTKGTRTLDV